jgi:hypothetical protein
VCRHCIPHWQLSGLHQTCRSQCAPDTLREPPDCIEPSLCEQRWECSGDESRRPAVVLLWDKGTAFFLQTALEEGQALGTPTAGGWRGGDPAAHMHRRGGGRELPARLQEGGEQRRGLGEGRAEGQRMSIELIVKWLIVQGDHRLPAAMVRSGGWGRGGAAPPMPARGRSVSWRSSQPGQASGSAAAAEPAASSTHATVARQALQCRASAPARGAQRSAETLVGACGRGACSRG